MKNYYFNENAFFQHQSPDSLPELLKAFKQLFDAAERNQGKLWIKDTFQYHDLRVLLRQDDYRKYALPFQLFGKCGSISMETSRDYAVERIEPDIGSEVVRELIYACNRDENERMVSLPQDHEAVEDECLPQDRV